MPYIGKSPTQAVRQKYQYTATASQTTFSGSDANSLTLAYTDENYIDVTQNGVMLKGGGNDYTATTGTSVVLATGATANDVIEIIVYDVFAVADHVKKSGDSMTGALTITLDDNTDNLTLTSTDADANSGPVQVLYRNSSSPADSDLIGEMHFRGRNDNSENVDYVTLSTRMEDVSDGTEDGKIILKTMVGGTARSRLEIDHTDVVVNQDSIDSNLRVETNNEVNMLFIDGGNDKIGIGTNAPDHKLDLATSVGAFAARITNNNDSSQGLQIRTSDNDTDQFILDLQSSSSSTGTDYSSKFVVHKNGHVGIGTTSSSYPLVISTGASSAMLQLARGTDGTQRSILIFRSSSQGADVGSVSITNTGVAYNTSSDYRLKENIVTDWDATTRLKQLKPSQFNFKGHEGITVDGFLAHEVSSIVPEAISGEKDEVETYTDDDGKEQTRPVYQGIDQSKLVPLLTKALQESIARADALEARIKKLEDG